jgi:heme/copper-type cytochrome/quinol oxidase subunit 2
VKARVGTGHDSGIESFCSNALASLAQAWVWLYTMVMMMMVVMVMVVMVMVMVVMVMVAGDGDDDNGFYDDFVLTSRVGAGQI